MDQKIKGYCFDEIGLVYEKAEADDSIAAILSEIETMALREAEENCGMLKIGDTPITREKFLTMNERDKEVVISCLSGIGLQGFIPSHSDGKITVILSPHVQKILGCTMFSLLNRLEKLDGAFNLFCPNATLELRVPLGERAGIAKCEMLILQLYPWLSVKELPINTVSNAMNIPLPADNSSSSKTGAAQTPKKKKGLFAKLSGK